MNDMDVKSTTKANTVEQSGDRSPAGPTNEQRTALNTKAGGKTRADAERTAGGIVADKSAPSPTNIVPANQLAKDLLAKNRGLFIGEEHSVGNPAYQFTKDNLADFKKAGVKVLGLEAFDKEDQHLLDNYKKDPSAANRDALMKASKWEVGADKWVDMVDEAHKNGIRVVGMDTAARRNPSHGLSPKEVNERWAGAINDALAKEAPGSKFIAYGGLYHSTAAPNDAGVNILGVPSIKKANPNVYTEWNYFSKTGGYGVLGYQGGEYYAVDTTKR